MTDPWLTTAQALQEFGISPSTLKDWAARGWVEAHRPDRRSLRVHRASLEARLANRPKRGPKPKEESMAQTTMIEVKPRQTWALGPPGGDVVTYYVMDITTRVRRQNGERRSVLCASCVVVGTGVEKLIDFDVLKPPRYRLVRDEHGKRVPAGEEG